MQLIDSGLAIARRVQELLGIEQAVGAKQKHRIYASAPPWEESALNIKLEQLGFNPVQPFLHPI